MTGFVDEAVIEVFSGNGGSGAVSFRREKYVPKGGPDGGDGGQGGNVVFKVRKNLKTLFQVKRLRIFRAKNGQPGMGRKKHGKNGEDVIIQVPPGTYVRDFYSEEILKDLKTDGEEWVFLKGGKGGKGNSHFATARKQTPRYAQPGIPGVERKLQLELNLIADIGFVGLPNAGKSTLLDTLTNAHPQVAPYPFTTKIPNLGVLQVYERDIILADIPGIIQGASQGAGLGIQFLKHISRTFLIILMVDMGDPGCLETPDILRKELGTFSSELLTKSKLIIGTKMDLDEAEENLKELKKKYPGDHIIGISSFSRLGMDELVKAFVDYTNKSEFDEY